jgi:hypothetical protein
MYYTVKLVVPDGIGFRLVDMQLLDAEFKICETLPSWPGQYPVEDVH